MYSKHKHFTVSIRYLCHERTNCQSLYVNTISHKNASQQVHPTQPHTDAEIMNILIFPSLDEIPWNTFVYMNILVIIIQQLHSHKNSPIWNIWQFFNQISTEHIPGLGGGGCYVAREPASELPHQCVEGGSIGTASTKFWFTTGVVCHNGVWVNDIKGMFFHMGSAGGGINIKMLIFQLYVKILLQRYFHELRDAWNKR